MTEQAASGEHQDGAAPQGDVSKHYREIEWDTILSKKVQSQKS